LALGTHAWLPVAQGGMLARRHVQSCVSHVVHAAGIGMHLFGTLPPTQYSVTLSHPVTRPHE
jgi:hypothetical protein